VFWFYMIYKIDGLSIMVSKQTFLILALFFLLGLFPGRLYSQIAEITNRFNEQTNRLNEQTNQLNEQANRRLDTLKDKQAMLGGLIVRYRPQTILNIEAPPEGYQGEEQIYAETLPESNQIKLQSKGYLPYSFGIQYKNVVYYVTPMEESFDINESGFDFNRTPDNADDDIDIEEAKLNALSFGFEWKKIWWSGQLAGYVSFGLEYTEGYMEFLQRDPNDHQNTSRRFNLKSSVGTYGCGVVLNKTMTIPFRYLLLNDQTVRFSLDYITAIPLLSQGFGLITEPYLVVTVTVI
jgi:hypothetical protein